MVQRTVPARPGWAALIMLLMLAGMWMLELLDQLSGNQLDQLGIHAREIDGMPEILTAPFLACWLGSPDQQLAAIRGARISGAPQRAGSMAGRLADHHCHLWDDGVVPYAGPTRSSSVRADSSLAG